MDTRSPSATRKLRVTILASEWGSSNGGLSTIDRELAIQLAKCPEVQVTFFLPQCTEEDKRTAFSFNIDIVKAKRRAGFGELEWLSFAPEHLPIDVIVGHGVKLGRQAQVIRESHKCKWIQVVHTDPEELGMFKSYQNPISMGEKKHKIEVELCEMADLVVGVGPKLSEAFRTYLRWCKKDQTILDITPGVFNEFANVEHAAEERKWCSVLVFGRGDAEDFQLKGFDIAGRAVAELKYAHVIFVGAPEGKHEKIAERFLECGVPANRLAVRSFMQSREGLRRLFCEVDLVLMPSRTEGFGLTGLEALSAGLPVLVSKNSGFGGALSQVPLVSSCQPCVIDSYDSKVWAEAIEGIWNKDRERRLQEADELRTSYEKKYSWAKQCECLIAKMINIVDDCQSSTQRKGRLPLSSHTQATQKMEFKAGEHCTAVSIIHYLQQMRCDKETFNKETSLSEDLQTIASEKGFTICNNPASGNCMFYALSEQLQRVKGIQISHKELRETLVKFLRDSPSLASGTDLFNFVHGYKSWAKYLRSMENDGTWGDHLILYAAANCYQTHIRVISSLDCEVVISPDHLVPNINPLVLGHIHEKHYVSLQPRQGRHLESSAVAMLSSIKENSNYARLCCLLVKMVTNVLRDIFDSIHPPGSLKNVLTRDPVRSTLQSLRKKRVINPTQWGKLYPASSSSPVSSTDFDVTLLLILLGNICGLSPAVVTADLWENPPTPDISRDVDIALLRHYRDVVYAHAEEALVDDATFSSYWREIRGTLIRLGGASYKSAIDNLKTEDMGADIEQHYKELLKQWKKDEDAIRDHLNVTDSKAYAKRAMKTAGEGNATDVLDQTIERVRQLYRTREERLLPVPWCEDFNFHLNEIFTRLRIVSKEKTRGTLTEEITNMTAIFKARENCCKPRTVLIEGEPGIGKTTYCQKLAYDWATKHDEWDESFPEIELLLLLRCHDIKSDIWEAIDEQLLPQDVHRESKEIFFKFIRENQSKVLLVLDGLDEADPSKLPMYINLVQSRELSKCHIVITSRHEAGVKVRRYCDILWEIIGFTNEDAERFIFNYFGDMEHLAHKLLNMLSSRNEYSYLHELTSNPLNTALLCILCEDFNGVFPTSRTQLYIEIVLCVLRRFEKKKGLLSSTSTEDLIKVYKEELLRLGLMALKSLRKGELYFEEGEFTKNLSNLTKFGFLSVQAGGSKRKPCTRYGFLHKSFQEFFAGFFLACQILSGEIDFDSVVADKRYLNELKQVFLFMSGIVTSGCKDCKETMECLVSSIASQINLLGRTFDCKDDVSDSLALVFHCIKECTTYKDNLQSRMVHTLGSHLDLETLGFRGRNDSQLHLEFLFDVLRINTTITNLDLSTNGIGDSDVGSFSSALQVNSTLTKLDLSRNRLGPSGASFLSLALKGNTTMTNLDLRDNDIHDSGAGFFSDALKVNTNLTHLGLSTNSMGDSSAGSLSEALTVNTTLAYLDLSWNRISPSGACLLGEALTVNTTLTNLNLSNNEIDDIGADSLAVALKVNSTLTHLDLHGIGVGPCGARSLAEALNVNTALANLNMCNNWIGDSGAVSFSEALKVNTKLTSLNLRQNRIGTSGAGFLSDAMKVNTTLTNLDLGQNRICPAGAASLSEAQKVNTTLILNY